MYEQILKRGLLNLAIYGYSVFRQNQNEHTGYMIGTERKVNILDDWSCYTLGNVIHLSAIHGAT